VKNEAADPKKDFNINNDTYLAAGDKLQAVLHSHVNTVPTTCAPSEKDMQGQMDSAVIWGILPVKEYPNQIEVFDPLFWGDFRLEEPLIGRKFIHGVSDCYSLIRAWFWQTKKIILPEYARDNKWWEKNQDLYQQGFPELGFVRIEESQRQAGDFFLGKVRSSVPNHGGVLLDNGIALHHLEGRLSRREPILRWQKFITHWLRYVGTKETGGT